MSERAYRADAKWPVLAILREYGRPHLRYLLAGLAIRLAWMIPARAGAPLVGLLFETVFTPDRTFSVPVISAVYQPTTQLGELWLAAGLLAALSVVGHAVNWVGGLVWGIFAYRLQHDVRSDTYDTVQRLEMGFFDDHQTGEVMSVLTNDVNEMEDFFTDTIDSAAEIVLFVLGAGFFMVLLNWQFAIVALSVAPVIVVANKYFSTIMGEVYARVREVRGALNAQLRDSVTGIEVVKAYTGERFERERVADASRVVVDSNLDVVDVSAKHYPSMRALTGVGQTLTFGVGVVWVTYGPPGPFTLPMTTGVLITFLIYGGHLAWPMQGIAGIIESYQSANASADRILGVQTATESVTDDPDATALDSVEGHIEYDDVTFGYPESDRADGPTSGGPVLEDVSIEVEAGETVGIVGPTGAGKSTLLKLLFRFYDPDEGSVRLDGHDVRDLSLSSLRDGIGYISQDPFLFSGTVRENVTYGTPGANEDAIRRALERAKADAFVADLPNGLDTTIGERGVKLSGGQRQRLCLARAMLDDSSVLVLDEATSHVDNETEVLIQRGIESVVEARTTLIVAHRLSTVRDADRIVVLDGGCVVETGTHEELLDAEGLYATLWRVQVGNVDALPAEFLDRVERRADRLDSE